MHVNTQCTYSFPSAPSQKNISLDFRKTLKPSNSKPTKIIHKQQHRLDPYVTAASETRRCRHSKFQFDCFDASRIGNPGYKHDQASWVGFWQKCQTSVYTIFILRDCVRMELRTLHVLCYCRIRGSGCQSVHYMSLRICDSTVVCLLSTVEHRYCAYR